MRSGTPETSASGEVPATPTPGLGERCRASMSWFNRPLSGTWCVVGWLGAIAVFMGVVRFVGGGPSEIDLGETIYSTWAVAHGHLSCAYSPVSSFPFPFVARPGPFIAPLWPLVSGWLSALFGVGHNVAFPSGSAMGPNCSTALVAMYKWSLGSNAVLPTMRIGYVSWLILMAGVVAVLRASGRGRCGWEPTVLVLLALASPVWMPLTMAFHPQDLIAMGLALGGLACVLRGRWVWAGVLLGLAITSQQFALLVLAPLIFVVPPHRRVRLVGSAIGMWSIVVVPMLAITSGRAFRAVVLGSGNTPSIGGTVLSYMHLDGVLLVIVSRVLPIVVAMALARWAMRRLGPGALAPLPLISLVATSLALRLVFEQNIFGYYFLALCVTLVLLDAIKGRIRGELVAWVALITLVSNPVPFGVINNSVAWGYHEREVFPLVLMAVGLLLLGFDAIRGQIRWYLVAWLVAVALAYGKLPWTDTLHHTVLLPDWAQQVVLVGGGLALAIEPLLVSVRDRQGSGLPTHLAESSHSSEEQVVAPR